VHVTVADEGPGIGPEEAERVFERFYRGSAARAKGEGSGLGLHIAWKVVVRHGGRITLENARIRCVARVALPFGQE
jgi:two-component system OmpR family sensor kinase